MSPPSTVTNAPEVGKTCIFQQQLVISRKRCKAEAYSLWKVNRKSYVLCWTLTSPMILSGCNHPRSSLLFLYFGSSLYLWNGWVFKYYTQILALWWQTTLYIPCQGHMTHFLNCGSQYISLEWVMLDTLNLVGRLI